MARHAHERHRRQPESFRCRHCRLDVAGDAPGTAHRNHCPPCLWSRHVDDARATGPPSRRAARPWVLVHRCTGCRTVHLNRTAGDDNPLLLVGIAVGPLARPPFPLELLRAI
ncbi:MAG TPA: RNHCP domain-containing protein [Acidimicrobiales bacterium]|nr:RNHCP domain-containing protein [Acidimicrobiales bacterium]